MGTGLEARGLSRRVADRVLYRDLELRLAPGETLAVQGASGTGKSQLLRQLARLDAGSSGGVEESGELWLDGRTPEEWGARRWRAEVALVPQAVPRLEGAPEATARALAELAVLRERGVGDLPGAAEEAALELGLSAEDWRRPWVQLSGGEGQRALLALAAAREPRVLLLDEPTAALDPGAVSRVEAFLRGRTCVWVTHSGGQAERVASQVLRIGEVSVGS
jgi:ATPase subunit of ABC transporter with duplicated ATPase domains